MPFPAVLSMLMVVCSVRPAHCFSVCCAVCGVFYWVKALSSLIRRSGSRFMPQDYQAALALSTSEAAVSWLTLGTDLYFLTSSAT